MDVVEGVHLDKRWNPIVDGKRVNPQILSYLIPGCGFGGSCFPKDVQALRSQGQSLGNEMRMLNAILGVNESQPHQVIKILENSLGQLTNLNVLLLGLAFKPGTDDVRESPAIKIANDLAQRNIKTYAHDPIAIDNFKRLTDDENINIEFVPDWRSILDQINIIIIVTPWSEYGDLRSYLLQDKVVFDSRRLFLPKDLNAKQYVSIGHRI